jgi:chemotaxis protein histidine kinase CheA
MADAIEHQSDDIDMVVCTAQAALEAALERKKRAEEEAEEKWKAEEAETKRKAEEAERKEAVAKEAERVAKEAAEKKKAEKAEAERAEKARTAQAAYEAGIWAVQADQRNSAEQMAWINAQALATKRKNLGRLRVRPNDPLLQAPMGPGPSNAKVRRICKELVHQPRKRKLGDDDDSVILANAAGVAVSFLLFFDFGSADLESQAGKCEHCAHLQEECLPGNGQACATCNGRKVGFSFLQKGKKSAEFVADLDEEVTTPKPKRPKMSGTQPVAGKISVNVGPSKDSLTETVAVLREQNDALRCIIDTQKPILDAAMNQMWLRKELVRQVGQIADALEVMAPRSSSWGSSEY